MALRGVDLDRDRETLALVERRTSRKQRLDVNVVAQADEYQVEARKFALADPERRSHLFLVGERGLLGRVFTAYPMNLIRPQTEPAQHRAVRHPEIARRIVRRHASLVTPKELHLFPIDAQAEALGQQCISRRRRRSAGETEHEFGVHADRFAGKVRDLLRRVHVERLRVVQDDELGFGHDNPAKWALREG